MNAEDNVKIEEGVKTVTQRLVFLTQILKFRGHGVVNVKEMMKLVLKRGIYRLKKLISGKSGM